VKYTLTQRWDRSPDALAVRPVHLRCIVQRMISPLYQFSKEGNFIYFTAGDHAKVKVFVLPVPQTPEHSTNDPILPAKYTKPIPLTHTRAASGVQTLPNGRLIFTQSSFTSPNDVFIIRGLKTLESDIESDKAMVSQSPIQQVTRFTQDSLKGKDLSEGEEFWFKGAEDKDVQGWLLKPKGWKSGEEKKWPIVLLIHGGAHTSSFT
jgi:dipeptidyl aminopeptidase/acylaminoacyl peptidase